ncbi:MAG: nitrous oxide reductase family maturation protein NosD [Pseudomonadota bacterium]
MRWRAFLAFLAALAAGLAAGDVAVAPGRGTLAAAVAVASPGDTLRLSAGTYEGAVLIHRPLTLRGSDGAVVDGGGQGTVITIEAPGVEVSGLTVVGSGSSHETLDAGIKLTKAATGARVLSNTLHGNLHGIDIHGAADALAQVNTIVGRDDHRMNERGNGVYVWNAPGEVVRDNDIRLGRDGIFVNVSRENVFLDNRFQNLRFAVHYMYADSGTVEDNISTGNDLGYAIMFSRGVVLRNNLSVGDRDHGVMLNYANNALVEGNVVREGGEKCLFMYNANKNILREKTFEGCAIGIHFTAGSDRNAISGNAFIGNETQLKYVGSDHQEWSEDGRGNYWSDHASFDLDGDGRADQAYRPNDMIDHILWTQPSAKLLLGSPAVQLIRWTQATFPALLLGGVVDSAPLMAPTVSGVGR